MSVMTINHYPWNVQALTTWINQEVARGRTPESLAAALNVSPDVIQGWLFSPAPLISLEEVRAIAQYRGWGIDRTLEWLGITPAHWEEMLRR